MEIGKKLKNARVQSGMTQENVAEKINVSRQTISNWENEKSYPDIISVIELSNLYSISLDVLLKGDEKMIEHLEESTNVVKSNQKMIWAIIVNIIVVALLITLNMFIPDNRYFLVGIFCLMVITSSALLYQISVSDFWKNIQTLTADLSIDVSKPIIERYAFSKISSHLCEFCIPLKYKVVFHWKCSHGYYAPFAIIRHELKCEKIRNW